MPGEAGIISYVSELERLLKDMESVPSQVEHKAVEVMRACPEANREYAEGLLYRCSFRHFITQIQNLIDSIKKDNPADFPKDNDIEEVS